MTIEEDRLYRKRRERVARVKRILRWMPRRATVHRYPVLKWFARAARKRSYLWSFRVRAVVPALYAGCILAMLPLYGIQLPLAVALAFLMRVNLPILFSLQFLTNPVTMIPAYYTDYQVGKVVLNFFTIETPALKMTEMKALVGTVSEGNLGFNLKAIIVIWSVTMLGGAILGSFLATVASVIYKVAAYEVAASYQQLRELQRRQQQEEPGGSEGKDSHDA